VFVAPYYADKLLPSVHLPDSIAPLALVLGLSFVPMLGRALAAGGRAFMIAIGFTLGATAAYFGWHVVFELMAPQLDAGFETSSLKWTVVVVGLVVLFVAQTILQMSPNGWFANRVQPHLVSGLYIDDWFTRVTFRLWPPGFR
jgi:NAD(P)H-quinone oxidoreductase subunit 5